MQPCFKDRATHAEGCKFRPVLCKYRARGCGRAAPVMGGAAVGIRFFVFLWQSASFVGYTVATYNLNVCSWPYC